MLGDNIKQIRKDLHFNQKELADNLGVSQNVVSLYESNTYQPSIDALIKIAHLGEVSLDWLICGDGRADKVYRVEETPINLKVCNVIVSNKGLEKLMDNDVIGEIEVTQYDTNGLPLEFKICDVDGHTVVIPYHAVKAYIITNKQPKQELP